MLKKRNINFEWNNSSYLIPESIKEKIQGINDEFLI